MYFFPNRPALNLRWCEKPEPWIISSLAAWTIGIWPEREVVSGTQTSSFLGDHRGSRNETKLEKSELGIHSKHGRASPRITARQEGPVRGRAKTRSLAQTYLALRRFLPRLALLYERFR